MSESHRSAGRWFIVLSILAVVCISIVPLWRRVHESSRDARAAKCLMTIGMALYSYHDDYGSFPPAYITDETGKPKHSWRVLLLPYLGYDELYGRYDFDQPWDGPKNLALAENVCDIYGSATDPRGRGTMARFLAVVGPRTAWPGQNTVRKVDFVDGLAETILLLDCVDSDVKWTEPRDLSFRDALTFEGTGNYLRIARNRPQGVLFLDAGSTVGTLPTDFSPELLKSLLTINGGERIEE